ncbi:aldehyde dehydrogenase (NADP(+)) [Sphingomonas oryzagri]|uniref:Aldehyde dehydrogenase (NADP(+)) n=1 Tax=Sphingomonas oryzagri TaxID=3042314 RepID=A0ABT6MWL5_9SPHN|nr:aldehyde dehydrogenase (NADP(+)) [Sphingomonas oryzagri]MDH7637366.1 aldehyde dehydrogenase (NADP(+)) [Sphingomonas oryzagri]
MDGHFLIGARAVARDATFSGYDPSRGEQIAPAFSISTAEDVAEACRLAAEAFDAFRDTDPDQRARFLETIADNIDALGDALVARAMQESGLPQARLTGERGRTSGQLRLFATHLRRGDWAGVTFDTPLPDRAPLPRGDLRQRRIAIGPVAVFGASNFPLAFSVAGGDTASALAAGCPVVVKGHPAHPGTTRMVADAIRDAVAACGLPEGVFSLVQGPANELGAVLVTDPRIKAVGFTGSRGGGLALMKLAGERPEPIPVYAEMSSINPVILFPQALAARGEALAKAYVGSLTMGAGQFCTNPGIVIGIAGPDLDRFVATATQALEQAQPQVMLTKGIHAAYDNGVSALEANPSVETLARGAEGTGCTLGRAALFITDADRFLADPSLAHEVFGASSVVIRAKDMAQIAALIEGLEGQLTATLQIDEGDYETAAPLVPLLERKVGRILANGWPTGVEVSTAIVHGGPFPATSDPRSTSVGTAAIERFLRPVCYQDLPDALLPKAVRSANPLNLPRRIDGTLEVA